MPEGPEVAIITDGLNSLLKNKYIHQFILDEKGRYGKKAPDNFIDFSSSLPLKITSIKCKGKFIYWEFDNGMYMYNTLGMSGVWSKKKERNPVLEIIYSSRQKPIQDTTKLTTNQFQSIYFMDQRHFATIKFVTTKKELETKLKTIGPDMLNDPDMSYDKFANIIKKQKSKNITTVLMNQKVISGVGNYLKSESLYHARISPHRTCDSLTDEELKTLYQAIRVKIVGSFNEGGVSKRHYKDIDDKQGQFTFKLEVYGLKKDKNGHKIKHELTLDKRFTYWVPEIQK